MAKIESIDNHTDDEEKQAETIAEGKDSAEDPEFDEILAAAAPKVAEMARQAREMRRMGRTRKFPA